jgi:GntR family transcriptional regulator/MocR family aminotransferase
LRVQVEDGLRDAIRSGRLSPGTLLPSTRAVAADLGVTRGVIVAAYDQLVAEGYLVSQPGSGTLVNEAADRQPPQRGERPGDAAVLIDFHPGLPDVGLFPRPAWLRATRRALQRMPESDLGYVDPRGLLPLRDALAGYLGRVRGVSATPDQVLVCNGFAHGLGLVVQALVDSGLDVVAVEHPGHGGPRDAFDGLGIRYRGIEVDDDGIVVEQLRRSGARVVVVTPAHQCPTGAVLSPARRTALTRWARDVNGYIIEDDYDAEYRYDRHPIGALQGVAPDRVIYGGTLSKSLAPGLRLGWFVLPGGVIEPVLARRKTTDYATSSITQATCAEFVTNGDLDRHLRRTRRIYRQRRDALIDALARWLPDWKPTGIAAGLHVLVALPAHLDEALVIERALAAGVRVYPLSQYRASRRSLPPGVVLGYGQRTVAEAEQGVGLLAGAVARV